MKQRLGLITVCVNSSDASHYDSISEEIRKKLSEYLAQALSTLKGKRLGSSQDYSRVVSLLPVHVLNDYGTGVDPRINTKATLSVEAVLYTPLTTDDKQNLQFVIADCVTDLESVKHLIRGAGEHDDPQLSVIVASRPDIDPLIMTLRETSERREHHIRIDADLEYLFKETPVAITA